MEEETVDPYKRDEKGRLLPGHPGGPGRPKGKTMKEFAREYFLLKTDEEKIAYIEKLEEKKPGFAWTMGEGNPANNLELSGELTSKVISIDE